MQAAVHCGFAGFPTASGSHLNGCWGGDRFIWKVNTALWQVTKEHGIRARNLLPPVAQVPLGFLFPTSFFKSLFSDQLLNFSRLWISRAPESAPGMLQQSTQCHWVLCQFKSWPSIPACHSGNRAMVPHRSWFGIVASFLDVPLAELLSVLIPRLAVEETRFLDLVLFIVGIL